MMHLTTEALIGLPIIAAGLLAMVMGARADARAERAYADWMRRYHEWLDGGMKGPRP